MGQVEGGRSDLKIPLFFIHPRPLGGSWLGLPFSCPLSLWVPLPFLSLEWWHEREAGSRCWSLILAVQDLGGWRGEEECGRAQKRFPCSLFPIHVPSLSLGPRSWMPQLAWTRLVSLAKKLLG